MANGYTFTKRSAERITRVVRDVERGGRDQPPVYFRRSSGDDGGGEVIIGKTTEAWLKNTSQEIEIWDQAEPPNEEAADPPKTQLAWNKFYPVASGVWVLIAKSTNGKWYLVEAAIPDASGACAVPNIGGHDLTTVSGYQSGEIQILGHDSNGCLKWYNVCDCEEPPP